ncbi:MAG: pyruvate dehydrogenase complex dihydrolipoamide acetyltransferase [Chlamydiales bacterium]
MPFTVTMPKLSPTMEEGTIAKWHKQEGDYVEAGELLIEVATDKATVEHNAFDPGYLRKILISEGESAKTNQPIAVFTEEENESIEDYEPEGIGPKKVEKAQKPAQEKELKEEKKEASSEEKKELTQMAKPRFVPFPAPEKYEFPYEREKRFERQRSSPLARKLAAEKGLDISAVKGTGPNGRVMSRDLTKAPTLPAFQSGSSTTPKTSPGSFHEESLTPMRKAIAKRLQESKTFIPHFYVRTRVDADALVMIREQLKSAGAKITYNDFVIRASALALRQHPQVNSGFNTENDTLIRFDSIDISVAVTLQEGLITPIIRHADYKALSEISAESKYLAAKAREHKLLPEEFQGGSFTVSNMGMFEVTDFQAIINPPQSAILAVGAIHEEPVVKNGSIVVGKTLYITLSVDHRVIDGVAAAQFIQEIKHYLEHPALLMDI